MRVVIDTNVIVSALINSHGHPARIIDLVVLGQIVPVFDDRIIAEYREVISRPKFSFRAEDISTLLELFEVEGESVLVPPLSGLDLPDMDDAPFVEVTVGAACDFLITGNTGHFPKSAIGKLSKKSSISVIAPAVFLEKNLYAV